MKKFLLATFLFTSTTGLIIYFLNALLIQKNRSHAKFKFPDNIDKVVFDFSHSECAFDDSLITNFANFAQSGEVYFYSYPKVKNVLEQNPNVKTVFIGFSNFQISANMTPWIWGNEILRSRYATYSPFLRQKDEEVLLRNNFLEMLKVRNHVFKTNLLNFIEGNYDFVEKNGGYIKLERDKTDSLLSTRGPEKNPFHFDTTLSETNIHYLEEIIRECKAKNVSVFLVRTPVHPQWEWLFNEDQFQTLLKTRFSSVGFLDFKNFPLKNSEFGDLEHLNYKGATKFSVFFNKLVADGLLEKRDKQQFIDSTMMINPNQ